MACEWAVRTAVEQGLPPKIEDRAFLHQVAVLKSSPAALRRFANRPPAG